MYQSVKKGVTTTPTDITTHDEATSPQEVQGAHARSRPRPLSLTGNLKVWLPWRAGARESSSPFAPSRASSIPALIGHCFLIMQIICVDSKDRCLTSPITSLELRAWLRESSGGSLESSRPGPQARPRVPPAHSGPALPPAPPPFSPPHPLYALPPVTPPPVQRPALAALAPPPPSWPSPPVLGGVGGTGGTGGTTRREDWAGRWPRRPEGQRRPPAPSRAWVSVPRTAASA